MSYRNPNRDTHGRPITPDNRYRVYCADRHSYRAEFAEGEDGELIVRLEGFASWQRYDELQAERVVPVDQYGVDIPAPEGGDASTPSVELLQADLDEIANLRNRQHRIVRAAADRLGLTVQGQYLDDDLAEDFETMMTSGEESAAAILDWIEARVPPITRVVAQCVGRPKETSAA